MINRLQLALSLVLALAFILLFGSQSASATIGYRAANGNAQSNFDGGTTTSVSVDFNVTTLSGSTLLCLVYGLDSVNLSNTATAPTISACVTSGISWNFVASESFPSNTVGGSANDAGTVALYYASNAPAVNTSTATSSTATAPVPGSGNYTLGINVMVLEVVGAAVSSLDATAPGANGIASAIPTAGNLTPSSNTSSLIIVSEISGQTPSSSAGAGFGIGPGGAGLDDLGASTQESAFVASASPVTCIFGNTGVGYWAAIAAEFKGVSAPIGSGTPRHKGWIN
jgi:hypothetical protein